MVYSEDLRKRVVEYVECGNTQACASELFQVSTSTVSRWCKIYKESGRVRAQASGGSKGRVDIEKLRRYVEDNPDATQAEMGERVCGMSICDMR